MTDPSTLFLNALKVQPSWTQNGLTFQFNVAPNQVSNGAQTEVGDSVFAISQSSSAILSASVLSSAITASSTCTPTSSTVTHALMQSDSGSASNGSGIISATKSSAPHAEVVKSSNSAKSDDTCGGSVQAAVCPSDQVSSSQSVLLSSVKKVAIGTPWQVTEISGTMNNFQDNAAIIQASQSSNVTPLTISSAGTNATCTLTAPSQALTTKCATSVPITINGSTASNNAGIPVGIAVARQRYVSNTSCKSQSQNLKDTMTTSTTTLPYMSTIPYQQPMIEPSLFPSSIANIGVVAGTAGCDDRTLTNLGGNIFPSIIAWPPQQQQQSLQPWYPCSNPIETSAQNMPPACAGYQLVRDPVNGHIILIPTNQIGSTQSTSAAGFTTTNQQIQSFIIPPHYHHQQQSQTHSVFLDHLVSIVPSSTNTKQANSVSSTVLKLNDGVLTGVMMPCDMTKSTAAVGQQVISANNSSISLVQQFNSSNIHNTNINSPHHFSSISSSGSLLIQQISGNTGQPPVINHINNSVMIAESTAMQSVINTQPSYLFNSQVSSDPSSINQVHPQPTCIVTNNPHQSEPPTLSQLPDSAENISCPPNPSLIPQLKPSTERQLHTETKAVSEQVCVQNEGKTVIKVDLNSSVQDASNQTDCPLDDDDDEETEDTTNTDRDEPETGSSEGEEKVNGSKPKISKCKRLVDEKKVYSDENPDFSGLQLLLNGIERAESNVEGTKCGAKSLKEDTDYSDKETDKPAPNGLEILCALADQRFKEEKNSGSDNLSSSDDDNRKRKLFRTKSSKRDARRRLSLKTHDAQRFRSLSPCDEDQLKMRMELVKLQKKYRETRKELNRLTHRKHDRSLSTTRSPTPTNPSFGTDTHLNSGASVRRKPGRPRKHHENEETKCKADVSSSHKSIKPMKRPKLKFETDSCLDISDDDFKVSNMDNGDLSPPVLEPMCGSPKPKFFKTDILSPPTLIPSKKLFVGPKGLAEKEFKRPFEFECKSLLRFISDESSDEDSKANSLDRRRDSRLIPIAQKRKVGRPKKCTKESTLAFSDTAMARKPLPVASAVTNKFDRRSESFAHKSSEKQSPVTSSVVSTLAMLKVQRKSSEIMDVEHKPKITPKLKAEAKLKTWRQESPELYKSSLDFEYFPNRKKSESRDSPVRTIPDKIIFSKSESCIPKEKNTTSFCHSKISMSARNSNTVHHRYREEDFRITPELLDSNEKNSIRVLVSVGGLFRAGELTAIQPPDIYGIKLDGERGGRTHIHTKEEVLKNVLREIKGTYPIRVGTRVCAFWSSQYLSLYPGYVTSFSSPDSEDENYTAVEFDDGDSGKITINHIRLLPNDFSVDSRAADDCSSSELSLEPKPGTSGISFEEIPVDKQLHSPDRSAIHRPASVNKNDSECSPRTSCTTYSVSSRTSLEDLQPPEKEDVLKDGNDATTKDCEKQDGERKRLKKKHKTKMHDNSESSCKRKSHKRKSDTDDASIKSHKHRKHKHRHHKHHKRKSGHKHDTDSTSAYEKSTKYLDDENDWTCVPPYSDHLIDKNLKEAENSNNDSSSVTESTENTEPQLEIPPEHVFDEEPKDKENKEEMQNSSLNTSEEQTSGQEEDQSAVVNDEEVPSNEAYNEEDSDSTNGDTKYDRFWHWCGKGTKRNAKGRGRKEFYKSIKRRNEIINVGDCAVFLTAGCSTKPFIGRIESLWEANGVKMVKVNWFYHPEETTGLEKELPYLGALFESPHTDRNDVQTISHKCAVIPISEYRELLEKEPERIHNVYESNDLYYLAGYYDPTTKKLTFEDGV